MKNTFNKANAGTPPSDADLGIGTMGIISIGPGFAPSIGPGF